MKLPKKHQPHYIEVSNYQNTKLKKKVKVCCQSNQECLVSHEITIYRFLNL